MLHRDLTPLNVFVCEGRKLKLGDFGIARPQTDRRGVTARTLNPFAAPSDILAGTAPKWQARDDVYQVGQLLGMLIKGDARARAHRRDPTLDCSDHLKEIIHRCIGERRKRYETADHLIEALGNPPPTLKAGALRSLQRRAPVLHRHPEPTAPGSPGRRHPAAGCVTDAFTKTPSAGPGRPDHTRPPEQLSSSWTSSVCTANIITLVIHMQFRCAYQTLKWPLQRVGLRRRRAPAPARPPS